MRKLLLFITILTFPFILTCCSSLNLNSTEINKIFNTRIVGIDKLSDEKVRITLTTKSTNTNPQSGGIAQKSEILVSEGKTVFEAVTLISTISDKRPLFGHTEFIIIGEDTARDGILPYLDYITRDNEFRYNAKIYIVKGDSANNLISKLITEDIFLADKLSALEDNSSKISISSSVSLSEAMYIFDKPNISTYLPYIELTTNDTQSASKGYKLSLKGYAIFKEDKLQHFLTSENSRGINWIKNKIKSGFIIVKASNDKNMSMEIISAKASIKPKIAGNVLKCDIKVGFTTNITETMSKINFTEKDEFNNLHQQQEKQIKKEVEDIIEYAQKKNLDIFGIISNFVMANPSRKNELIENWDKLFPEVQFNVAVESKINRSYFLREPTGSK